MVDVLTDNKNLIFTTEADRLSVTPHAAQLFKDADSGFVFFGDGTEVAGQSADVRPVVDKTDDYTFVRTDEGRVVMANKATAITFTVPLNSSIAYPIDKTELKVMNKGAGVLTIAGVVGVTLNGTSTIPQYSNAIIRKDL